MADYEMVVVAFESETEAERVLDSLKRLKSQHAVDLKNAAIVVRESGGKVRIKETRDFDAKQGAIGGAVAGGLLGLLRGKLLKSALIGAAGGAAAGKLIDLGVDNDFLDEVADSLTPGSSAVVATIAFEHVQQAMAELEQYEGGRIVRHSLAPAVYQQLSDAVAD